RRVGGGQELLGGRVALVDLDPGRDRRSELERTGAQSAHDAVAPRGRPLPVDLRFADDPRHAYAMTSTRLSSICSSGVSAASFSITRWSAWMDTSTWSSEGSR